MAFEGFEIFVGGFFEEDGFEVGVGDAPGDVHVGTAFGDGGAGVEVGGVDGVVELGGFTLVLCFHGVEPAVGFEPAGDKAEHVDGEGGDGVEE
mgnify:FL=1